ncbi:hypothetical protein [Erythrobacter sp.]|uniref:hypothetical protein n=1 Tax=Erythrobacter sp. TaxID=1042 RepID=UPI00261690F1|nr:hypothetical protein [Erythrobacter sp.]
MALTFESLVIACGVGNPACLSDDSTTVALEPDTDAGPQAEPLFEPAAETSAPEHDTSWFKVAAPVLVGGNLVDEIIFETSPEGLVRFRAASLQDVFRSSLEIDSEAFVFLTEVRREGRFVTPADLEPFGIEVQFDAAEVVVRIDIAAEAQPTTTLSFAANRSILSITNDLTPADFSIGSEIFLQFRGDQSADGELSIGSPDIFAETLVGIGGGLDLAVAGIVEFTTSDDAEFAVDNLQVIKDWPEQSLRFTAGEIFPPTRALQFGGELTGVSLSKQFDELQPFRNLAPSGRRSFLLEDDSEVEVIVNQVVVQRLFLPAGQYDVDDLPLVSGQNDVSIIAQGPTGRVEVLNSTLTFAGDLLNPGLVDFGFSAGSLQNLGSAGPGVASGYVRAGLSETLTAGFNLQSNADFHFQAGFEAQVATPFGPVLVNSAYSRTERDGWSVTTQYDSQTQISESGAFLNASVFYEYQSRHFGSPFNTLAENRISHSGNVTVGLSLPSLFSINTNAFYRRQRDRLPEIMGVNFTVTTQVRGVQLNARLSALEDERGTSFSALVSATFQFGSSGRGRALFDTDQMRRSFSVERFSRQEIGDVAGRVEIVQSDTGTEVFASGNYVDNRFVADISASFRDQDGRQSGIQQIRGTLSTFAAFADGHFGFGRTRGVQDSFLLAKTHESLEGRQLEIQNSTGRITEAKTGDLGPAVLPLRGFRPIRNETRMNDRPQGYTIESEKIELVPAFGRGYVFFYGSANWRSLIGQAFTANGDPLRGVIATACQAGRRIDFFTSKAGRFVITGTSLEPVTVIIDGKNVGTFTPQSPDDESGLVHVPDVRLEVDENGLPLASTDTLDCR